MRPVRITICTADVGCGHTRAALAIMQALRERAANAEITLVEALNDAPAWFNLIYREGYLTLVRHAPRVAGMIYSVTDKPQRGSRGDEGLDRPQKVRLGMGDAIEARALRALLANPAVLNADVIICTHFLCARVLGNARAAGKLSTPLLTCVTDQHPHAVWLAGACDRLLVASPAAAATAIKAGVSPLRIIASGIPIDPRFSDVAGATNRDAARRELHVPQGSRMALLSGGGLGLGGIETAFEAILGSGRSVHATVVCGRSVKLHARCSEIARRHTGPATAEVVGFTNKMPQYMAAADVLVGKPGGLTTAEAAASGLAMVLMNPIPGQEERNAAQLVGAGAARVCATARSAGLTAAQLLGDETTLTHMRACARSVGRLDAAYMAAEAVLTLLSPTLEKAARGERSDQPPVPVACVLDEPGVQALGCVSGGA